MQTTTPITRRRLRAAVAGLAATAALLGIVACGDDSNDSNDSAAKAPTVTTVDSQEIEQLRQRVLELTAGDAEIESNLKTFDTLDFDVFSNQKWDRLGESHAPNVKVVWPDGHFTVGIDVHIEDLKKLFVHAPDTRIEEHPIGFGAGNMTIVEGVFEGTFTEPMPDGKGGFIQPTGKAFKLPMATIGIWENGLMVEEHLFWDNATYATQIGIS
jgi:SnoaL-like polyketide cyclase